MRPAFHPGRLPRADEPIRCRYHLLVVYRVPARARCRLESRASLSRASGEEICKRRLAVPLVPARDHPSGRRRCTQSYVLLTVPGGGPGRRWSGLRRSTTRRAS